MPNPVRIVVPGAQVSWNSLHHTSDPRYLTQDLLLVELPNGLFIDVSWFPEHDPRGAYHVTLCQGSWESQVRTWETPSLSEVILLVQSVAQYFKEPPMNRSCSSVKYEEYALSA
jgi:hypothetical protein